MSRTSITLTGPTLREFRRERSSLGEIGTTPSRPEVVRRLIESRREGRPSGRPSSTSVDIEDDERVSITLTGETYELFESELERIHDRRGVAPSRAELLRRLIEYRRTGSGL